MGIMCCGVQGEEELEETSAEMLYLGMLPNLSQYVVSGSNGLYFALLPHSFLVEEHFTAAKHRFCLCPCQIALLKLLLAAAPTSKAKTDSINILADVLPEEMP